MSVDIFEAIGEDFRVRFPGYHKSRGEGLAALCGVMLQVRSANLMELASSLPRQIGTQDHRYQYISRLLANQHIDCDEISAGYAREVFERLSAEGQTIVLMMDQSHINDINEMLMVSVRVGERALPVAWRVRETKGNIGFDVQKELLDCIRGWLSEDVGVMLAGDRFYGTTSLIDWCQQAGWGYRIRLKGNLTLSHEGGELTTGEAVTLLPDGLVGAELCGSAIRTNIGVLHEKGHKEPWIIAMDAKPGKYTVLDYGMRWGIETMFSDFKSRGFGLMKSQIQKPERLERLILVMSMAMYWAVSCGAAQQHKEVGRVEKKAAAND